MGGGRGSRAAPDASVGPSSSKSGLPQGEADRDVKSRRKKLIQGNN